MKPLKVITVMVVIAIAGSVDVRAGDRLAISIPKPSSLTPVQRLNREGVEAVKRHKYEKAAALFYKAYLYDPADPFTLNNLGYISELQGDLDRAQRFYALASQQGCNANIDRSSQMQLEGKPMQYAFENLQDVPMRVNRMNVDAMDLLSKNQGVQAIGLLREALAVDPRNPFTLNNLGVAYEAIGDYRNALKSYGMVAESRASEPVVVTRDPAWRGKSVSGMAAVSARRLEKRMEKMDTAGVHAVLFTWRGVFATNQNDWLAARQNFLDAYSLDPTSAFSLNNRGYVAEMDGDMETAQFYYGQAQKAENSNARIGLATRRLAEGERLSSVASDSNRQVDRELDKFSQDRRRQPGPIELTPRDPAPAGKSGVPSEKPSLSDVPSAASPHVIPQFPR